MKKALFGLVLVILITGFLLVGCDLDPKGTAPFIETMLTAGSQSDCENFIKKTQFKIGDLIWIGAVITDEDKDVVSGTLMIQKIEQGGQEPKIITIPTTSTVYTTSFMGTYIVPYEQGTWSILFYVTDSKGNKSNVVGTTVIVTK